jgi:hypothetical protein
MTMAERYEIIGTGFVQRVEAGGVDRIPPFDVRTGNHYWVLPMTFSVADPERFYNADHADGPGLIDKENLVLVSAVGCWHCEELYSPRLASRRCKGQP